MAASHTNRLIHETSPYLLQHAHNPVDWYPWGPEALERARSLDRPILLSIGYSACHWCHVMERESFEDEDTASLMNERFINIKVDREERPDLDSVYMAAVQAMTGHGGWPMTMFLTPEGVPYFGGTYFPPEDRQGMPAFRRILTAVSEAYELRREDVANSAAQVRDYLQRQETVAGPSGPLSVDILDRAAAGLLDQVDWVNGGFGRSPKFPQPMNLDFLLRYAVRTDGGRALQATELTLTKMAAGGIYDQIGGGFHRYSTDAYWLAPHFEKMLYDNAQLASLYLRAWQHARTPRFRQVVEETLDYVRREMTSPEGGFYSTQDADSEGEEGKFFLWTPSEVEAALFPEATRRGDGREDALVVSRYYGVTEGGNFEGRTILTAGRGADAVAGELGMTPQEVQAVVDRSRTRLFAAREGRIKPGRDEKVLTAWNGLMLRAFAEAAAVLERADYRETAERNASFLLDTMLQDGRLLRSYKDGRARLNGYLEDYAFLSDGLLALYETTFELRWLEAARSLADTMIAQFWDSESASFFDTSADHETLVSRPKTSFDNAIPSGNAVALEVLLRLTVLTGDQAYADRSVAALQLRQELLAERAGAFGRWLCALDFALGPVKEVAIIGDPGSADSGELIRVVRNAYRPNLVLAVCGPDGVRAAQQVPLLADRGLIDGRATAYVCEHYVCQQPVTAPADLAAQLASVTA